MLWDEIDLLIQSVGIETILDTDVCKLGLLYIFHLVMLSPVKSDLAQLKYDATKNFTYHNGLGVYIPFATGSLS